jgi:hypothetical protein
MSWVFSGWNTEFVVGTVSAFKLLDIQHWQWFGHSLHFDPEQGSLDIGDSILGAKVLANNLLWWEKV